MAPKPSDWRAVHTGDGQFRLFVLDQSRERGAIHTKVLRHSVGLQGEGVELVGVDGELLLDTRERLIIDEEKDLDQWVS